MRAGYYAFSPVSRPRGLGVGTRCPRELMPGWVSSHSLKAQLGTTWGCQPMWLLMAPESSPALLTTVLSTPSVPATSRAEWRTLPSAAAGDRVGWKGRGTAGPTANLIMRVISTWVLCARCCLSARPASPPWDPLKALCGQNGILPFSNGESEAQRV